MSEQIKFTSGPWYVDPVYRHRVFGPMGLLAVMDGESTTSLEDKANARLTAKAPELYDALREAIELINFFHGKPGWEEYQQSPEMKRFAALLSEIDGAK